MVQTIEAMVDEQGTVRLLEAIRLTGPRRALVTILEEEPSQVPHETALLSEASVAARHIIYSAAKITRRKEGGLPPAMERMKQGYRHFAGSQPVPFHGGSWRLPENVARASVLQPFVELYRRHSVPARPCKASLITTP